MDTGYIFCSLGSIEFAADVFYQGNSCEGNTRLCWVGLAIHRLPCDSIDVINSDFTQVTYIYNLHSLAHRSF